MVNKAFVRKVEDSCDNALCALGAKRPRRGTRYFEINKDLLCWIGLNQGKHDDFLRINPFIGIHHIPLMSLNAQIGGTKYKKGEYATISIHLGEKCPDVNQFIFYEDAADIDVDVDVEAGRLAQTIFDFGIDYANQYTDISNLLPILKSKIPMLGGYPERYAICLYLSGGIAEAKQFIADSRNKYKIEEDEDTQDRFDRFSNRLLEIIDNRCGSD